MGNFLADNPSSKHFANYDGKTSSDIRAPSGLRLLHLSKQQKRVIPIMLLGDLTALAIAWQVTSYCNQFYSPLPPELLWWNWLDIPSIFWVFAALTIIFFACGGLYDSYRQNYVRGCQLITGVYLLSLLLCYFYDPKIDPPRSLFFSAWLSSIGFIIGLRILIAIWWQQLNLQQKPVSVFIIAPGEKLPKLAQTLEQRSSYQIVGAALANCAHNSITFHNIINSGATEVLAKDLPQTDLASTLYWKLRRQGIGLRLIPSSVEVLHRRGISEICAGIPTLRVATPLFLGWDYRFKRCLDVIGALMGILTLTPFLIVIAIMVRYSSPGEIFFRQSRIGLHGKTFKMWKFRTMVANASAMQAQLEAQNQTADGIMFKIKEDPRITPIGHFLRQTSLDELPQLFNVLLGQMSLVGPRPLPVRDVEKMNSWHQIRHQVLPGITGLWQVSGRSDIEDFDDAARLDLYYIDNWSLNLDIDILIETIRIVLFSKGAY
ncbi:Exopolysaccharide biosynthesis polyprenyl glycosylphosphotransferase [Hyella patelloides LEGE 07179]|uniref:Exopolysaccharide biosynthesis polyprenyl glycosylphosphotransferase n=1 Tax=Hyella patelloides LEGE 07179 TaxID=945734 RepID=A0A563VQD8_9CYAN|nr:sugar transferase [Hyella patelloides]VEP13585.1 Exopolysaccharide biosynthesis polyprenyl glycosylphosphotransferase [Hyella patelloides LEGE 07179]